MKPGLLVVDPHPLAREPLARLLGERLRQPLVHVTSCGSTDEALDHLDRSALMWTVVADPTSHGEPDFAALRRLGGHPHVARLAVLWVLPRGAGEEGARQAGACLCLSKVESVEYILSQLTPLMRHGRHAGDRSADLRCLTPAEKEILQLMAQGLTNRLIANRLAMREEDVQANVWKVLFRLNVSSRLHAVDAARRLQLL